MTAFCIMAIDPGISGAVAFYFPSEPSLITVEDMPVAAGEVDATTLAQRIQQMKPDVAFVEHVSSMPGQGVASTFKFGASFGMALGVIAALQIPMHLVRPQRWKKHLGLSSDKERSRALALRLWPSSDAFARKKDDGRAEAALIARYAADLLNLSKEAA
jgi:crossover junction endodeoxyribonuclease RuvC